MNTLPLRKQLRQLLDLQLKNTRNVWDMEAGGTCRQRFAKARDGAVCIHRQLIKRAERRQAALVIGPRGRRGRPRRAPERGTSGHLFSRSSRRQH